MTRCNWCGTQNDLIFGKHYCQKCSMDCYQECKRCHRPFPDKKFFSLNSERCDSCHRKYLKEKLKTKDNQVDHQVTSSQDKADFQKLKATEDIKPSESTSQATDAQSNDLAGYVLLSKHAKRPKKASNNSAGYDLFAAENVYIASGKSNLVSVDLMLKLPRNTYARITDRAAIAYNLNIMVVPQIIENDYRGKISVLMYNFSKTSAMLVRGMRIAQIIFERSVNIDLEAIVETPLDGEKKPYMNMDSN